MITGQSIPIKNFLRQDRQYLIPRYQREYVWEEKQWDDLFNDLYKNYETRMTEAMADGLGYLESRNKKVEAMKQVIKDKIMLFGSANRG